MLKLLRAPFGWRSLLPSRRLVDRTDFAAHALFNHGAYTV